MDKRWRPTSECDESGGFNRLVGDFVFKGRTKVFGAIVHRKGLKSAGKKYKLNSNILPGADRPGRREATRRCDVIAGNLSP